MKIICVAIGVVIGFTAGVTTTFVAMILASEGGFDGHPRNGYSHPTEQRS